MRRVILLPIVYQLAVLSLSSECPAYSWRTGGCGPWLRGPVSCSTGLQSGVEIGIQFSRRPEISPDCVSCLESLLISSFGFTILSRSTSLATLDDDLITCSFYRVSMETAISQLLVRELLETSYLFPCSSLHILQKLNYYHLWGMGSRLWSHTLVVAPILYTRNCPQ